LADLLVDLLCLRLDLLELLELRELLLDLLDLLLELRDLLLDPLQLWHDLQDLLLRDSHGSQEPALLHKFGVAGPPEVVSQ
jgi:hypothetical protein